MLITRDILIEKDVCDDGLATFDTYFPNGIENDIQEFRDTLFAIEPKFVTWLAKVKLIPKKLALEVLKARKS